MEMLNVSVPEIYKTSQDFRFFLNWFRNALEVIHYDTEQFIDLYDPLRCKTELLWMLAWTMGFRYDDRNGLTPAYNRLILLYFMSMIRKKGSRDGVTLAAEVNLAQFNVVDKAVKGYTDIDGNHIDPNPALYNRLDDTSIPANAVYVSPNTELGYIDVVYFSTDKPVDSCIEYVRPLGVYLFQYAGVRMDSRTKIRIDGRLTGSQDVMPTSPTFVAHYTRNDYARLQRITPEEGEALYTGSVQLQDGRAPAYKRNSEETTPGNVNPGYRSLYSLQLCNNENIFRSLMRDEDMQKIFDVGYTQADFAEDDHEQPWNLLFDKRQEYLLTQDVVTIDVDRTNQYANRYNNPRPAPNPIMYQLGDAMDAFVIDPSTGEWVPSNNEKYIMHDSNDELQVVDSEDIDFE